MTAAPDTITGCSTARRSTTTRTPSSQTNAGAREARRTDTARFAIALHHCTIIAATGSFETDDAERWSKLPEGMTYEEWKNELSPKPQGNYRVGAQSKSLGVANLDLDKAFPEIRLPKKEYASVMSAINANYASLHNWQIISQQIVDQDDGAYLYSFLVGDFNEYRIIDKERIG